MTNKEMDQKIRAAFTEATPDVLGSVLADCKKQPKPTIQFSSPMANWGKKFTLTVAAAALVICLSLGWNWGLFGGEPTVPTGPLQTGTAPSEPSDPSEPDTKPTDPVTKPTDPVVTHPSEPAFTEPSQPTEPSVPTEPEPTDPQPTDPMPSEPTVPVDPDGLPTDLNTDADVLSKFQELFSCRHPGSNYFNMALCCIFEDASGIGLEELFYNGFDGESGISNEEKEALKAYNWDGELDATRCPADKMSDVLNELFGLSLWNFNEDALAHHPQLKDFVYLESTNSYYLFHNDALCAHSFEAIGFRTMLNGNTALYYMYEDGYVKGIVILKPYGDSYRIVSNTYIKDYGNDGAWPLLVDVLPDVPEPSVPDYFPVDMKTDAATVHMFQKLFENPDMLTLSNWNVALCHSYADVHSVDMEELFYNGCPFRGERITAEEIDEIIKLVGEFDTDIIRCDPKEMDKVLTELFGLTLADFTKDDLDDFIYLESTGCYYLLHGDALYAHELQIVGFRNLENGNVEVYYQFASAVGAVTLNPIGDDYLIVSNTMKHVFS